MNSIYLHHLRARFAADRKRTSLLVALMAVMAFLVIRQMLTAGPPAATAESIVTETAKQVEVSSQLTGVARVVRRWRREPVSRLSRDPFADPNRASVVAVAEPEPPKPAEPTFTEADGAFWKQLDTTLTLRRERARRLDARRDAVLEAAGTLTVHSIIAGSDERALIGDRVVRPGDSLDTPAGLRFVVEAVGAKEVVIQSSGFRAVVGLTAKPRILGPSEGRQAAGPIGRARD